MSKRIANASSNPCDGIEVRASSIHGRGVFAKRAFAKDEVVLQWKNVEFLTADKVVEVPVNRAHTLHKCKFRPGLFVLNGEPQCFVNHSCDPNTVTGDLCDIALRSIAPGEEITSSYQGDGSPGSFQCRCGSPMCVGVVKGTE